MKKIYIGLLTGIVFSLVFLLLSCQLRSLYMEFMQINTTVQNLDKKIDTLSLECLQNQRNLAKWYNFSLKEFGASETLSKAYTQILDFGSGRMGYLVFPSASVTLPIYHETEDAAGESQLEHKAGTALPVGGRGSHTVLSGELSAKRIRNGDLFYVHVLDDVLVYTVCEISGNLFFQSEDGEDRCTLAVSEGDKTVYISGTRLEPELEQQAIASRSQDVPIDRQTLVLAVTAALGAGMFPALAALIRQRKSNADCSL